MDTLKATEHRGMTKIDPPVPSAGPRNIGDGRLVAMVTYIHRRLKGHLH